MTPTAFVPISADAGAHAAHRARIPDAGGARTVFTGCDVGRFNVRMSRLLPMPRFIGANSAAADRRAAKLQDRTPPRVVAADAERHAKRMARFVDSHA